MTWKLVCSSSSWLLLYAYFCLTVGHLKCTSNIPANLSSSVFQVCRGLNLCTFDLLDIKAQALGFDYSEMLGWPAQHLWPILCKCSRTSFWWFRRICTVFLFVFFKPKGLWIHPGSQGTNKELCTTWVSICISSPGNLGLSNAWFVHGMDCASLQHIGFCVRLATVCLCLSKWGGWS